MSVYVMRCYVVALAISQFAIPSWAQQAALSPQAQKTLDHYLKVDCAVGEKRRVLRELLQFKAEVEPVLIDILMNGPSKESLKKYQRVREDQWTRHEAFLKQHPPQDLSAEDLKLINGLKKTTYVKEGLARFTRTHRNKAATALVEVDSATAREALKHINANDEELLTVINGARAAHRRGRGTLDGPISP
jgi:hypothetical protein